MTKTARLPALLALALGAALAHAQTGYVRPTYEFPAEPATGPTGTKLGDTPFFVSPYVGLAAGYDDNLFLSDENKKSSTLYVVSPGLKLDARTGGLVFQAAYDGQIGRYAQSEDDNYLDHKARAQLDVAFDRRNFLRLGLEHVRGHEPRGSTDRPIGNEPDEYRLTTPTILYAFGAPGAPGRIEAFYGEAHRKYENNREFTAGGDRETRELGGAFYWRVLPKTQLLAEVRAADISYRLSDSPFSGDERRYYGGVAWEPTALISTVFKAGRLQRRFDTGERPRFSGTSWEAAVSWLPRTYSRVDFYTARQTNESTGLGNFILTSVGGVAWTHTWSAFITSAVEGRLQRDDYQGFDREDDIALLSLKVGYRMRRWLTLGAEYSHTRRDSNIRSFDYDRNLVLLTATLSL